MNLRESVYCCCVLSFCVFLPAARSEQSPSRLAELQTESDGQPERQWQEPDAEKGTAEQGHQDAARLTVNRQSHPGHQAADAHPQEGKCQAASAGEYAHSDIWIQEKTDDQPFIRTVFDGQFGIGWQSVRAYIRARLPGTGQWSLLRLRLIVVVKNSLSTL